MIVNLTPVASVPRPLFISCVYNKNVYVAYPLFISFFLFLSFPFPSSPFICLFECCSLRASALSVHLRPSANPCLWHHQPRSALEDKHNEHAATGTCSSPPG